MNMDTIITRYMSFPKFVSFLKDGLFIPNGKLFEDKWEGWLPIKIMRKEAIKSYIETFHALAQWIYVSCWHKEECENYAMWKIYGQISEAVAIDTTMDKLKMAYLNDYPNTLAILDEIDYALKENQEQKYFSRVLRLINKKPIEVGIGQNYYHMKFFFFKDKGFDFEHEVRLVALDESFNLKASNTKAGIYVNFRSVESFIQKVKISPTAPKWFEGLVSDLLKRYGIATKIEHSRFFEQPPTL
jgi:hypothetical protein